MKTGRTTEICMLSCTFFSIILLCSFPQSHPNWVTELAQYHEQRTWSCFALLAERTAISPAVDVVAD